MAKVFRIHKNGKDTYTDWCNSDVYGTNVINEIEDPDGAKASKEITSIPSPFARIDLVKTAFKEITDKKELDGNTIYHKMVSDSLDVAEIFFNYENLSGMVEVIEWQRSRDLAAIKNNPSHIGDTLETYLVSDAKTYNFDKMDSLYILNYVGPGRKGIMDIIGATSPTTLFFSSANDLNRISQYIHFGQDCPFDNNYNPLYKRDFDFVKYLFTLRKSYSEFSTDFPEFNEYLDQSFEKLNDQQKNDISNIGTAPIDTVYETLRFGNTGEVSILKGLKYHTKPKQKPNSDFEIASDLCDGDKPLVLPVERGAMYADYVYVNDKWGKDSKAPYYDGNSIETRHLPFCGMTYPYLTICDFLEEYLVKLPYETNSQAFFDGNKVNKGDVETYLTPIKPLYFKYFDKQKLFGEVAHGIKSIEMKEMAGGCVVVILRIPVKGGKGYVEYNRMYSNGTTFNTETNEGGIKTFEFALGLFPNVDFKNDKDAYYRIGLVSEDSYDKYRVHCFCGASEVKTEETVRNENDTKTPRCETYSIDGHRLDYLQVDCTSANAKGLAIPLYRNLAGNDKYTFAIDLGTSNTHVEYCVNGSHVSKPFDITENDMQLVTLLTSSRDVLNSILDADFVPKTIGASQGYEFPFRTVLSAAGNVNWNQAVLPMGHANVAFTYGKKATYNYNRLYQDIKWSNETLAAKRMQAYIESLMLILRSKVVMNGGDLTATKIVWFYPVSMSKNKVNQLSKIWKEAYVKFFGDNDSNVMHMTESVAPYEYYKAQYGAADIVTIDIGGGTSDVVISSNNQIEYITSFRFAANSIFSNTLNTATTRLNGVVRLFMDNVRNTLNDNNMLDLLNVFNQIEDSRNSADMASFFFSLPESKAIIDKGISKDVDFNNMLSLDDKQKIIFILFYTAIIYHVACIMKNKSHRMPRYIAFSGNGSKVVPIVTTDKDLMSDYTMKIFETVYGCKYDKDGLEMIFNQKRPKEATCKGGISCDSKLFSLYNQTLDKCKLILKGVDNKSFAEESDIYEKIDDAYISKVVEQVNQFVDTFFDLNKQFKFSDNFGVNTESIKIAKEVCGRDIEVFVRNGLEQRLKEVGADQPIEETMFFYPIIGIMNALADKISG